MSRSQSELEGRLDDMLSRIAMETQEIQELEQQLTDGQIQVNESLQSDLRGIIYGLQKNLRRLRDEAHRAWQQVHSLQNENHSLQLHLEDTQSHCRQLEDAARTHTQDSSVLRSEALRDTEVELEADLQQLREELTRQVTLRQLECEALQAAVDKEEQTREIRESQLQSTINTLQDVGHRLQVTVDQTRTQLDQTRTQLDQTRTQLHQTRTQLDQTRTRTQLDQTRTRTQLDQCTDALHDPQTVQSGTEDHEDMARIQTRIGRAQLQQDQDQVVHHVEQDQVVHHVERDQVVHHVEQDQESDLQRSRSSHRHLRDGHQRRLNRKLRQLRETMNNSVSDQLTPIIQQLRALNQRAELLHPQESLCVCECVHREAERLEQEKKKLQLETRQLQYTLRRHRSVLRVCDEVECVEKTLLKRRAELRQADRLLLEAQSCIHTTREQASSAQWEVDDWQLEATHTPRGHRRSDVLSDCQEAQRRLDSVVAQSIEEALCLQQGQRLEEEREEEQRLQNTVQELSEQLLLRRSTASAVREEQQKVLSVQTELLEHRAELKRLLQELLVEQQALQQVKNKRTQSLQRLHKKRDELDGKQEELDRKQEELDRKQEELDRIQDAVDKRKEELDRKQQEVDGTRDQLAKVQDKVDRKREELAVLKQEVDSHRKEAESCLKNTEQQRAELQQLQEEKSGLQGECRHLEARRRHAHRCLSAVEAELAKQREEHGHAQLLKEEVVRDAAANQEQLNGRQVGRGAAERDTETT